MGHLQMAVALVVVLGLVGQGLAATALEKVPLHLHRVSRCRF